MNKRNIITLAVLFTTATLLLIVSQNTSANLVDGVGFHGQVKNSDGSWSLNGSVTVRATFRENSTIVGTVYVGYSPYLNLPSSYNMRQDEIQLPHGSYEILAWDAAGHVGIAIVNFNGQPTSVPTITLSKASIY